MTLGTLVGEKIPVLNGICISTKKLVKWGLVCNDFTCDEGKVTKKVI